MKRSQVAFRVVVVALVGILGWFGAYLALSQRDSARAADSSNATLNALIGATARAACVQSVVANDDEDFRHDIRALLLAGRDRKKIDEILARMVDRKNEVDVIIKTCGPGPTTTTIRKDQP